MSSTAAYQSDSDTDDEYIKQKKPRTTGTRARRGLAKKVSSTSPDSNKIASESAIYSTQVTRCFSNIARLPPSELCISDDSDDDEDDKSNVAARKSGRQNTETKENHRVPILDVSDDEDELLQLTPQEPRVNPDDLRSPSPPTPPPQNNVLTRRSNYTDNRKYKGKLKKALKNLSTAQVQLEKTKYVGDFQSPEPDVCVIDDGDDVTVRVQLGTQLQRYTLKVWQTFAPLISHIASTENTDESNVMLVHKDKTLQSTDTPASINLHTADILECHIGNPGNASLIEFNDSLGIDDPDELELCFQGRNSKQKILLKTQRTKPLSILMKNYAGKVGTDMTELQFLFDGDVVSPGQTPASLDMEDGDCIDVIESR